MGMDPVQAREKTYMDLILKFPLRILIHYEGFEKPSKIGFREGKDLEIRRHHCDIHLDQKRHVLTL